MSQPLRQKPRKSAVHKCRLSAETLASLYRFVRGIAGFSFAQQASGIGYDPSEGAATHPMADQKHLDMLEVGAHDWNEWRRTAAGNRPDLSGAIIQRCLNGYDLSGADLTGSYLIGIDLSGVNLRGAKLDRADLTDTTLTNVDLSLSSLKEAVGLREAALVNAKLEGAWLPSSFVLRDFTLATALIRACGRLSLAVISVCVFVWLLALRTPDAALFLTDGRPGTNFLGIPISRLLSFASVCVVCAYLWLHVTLISLWDDLADRPAVYPDGDVLHRRLHPWMVTSGLTAARAEKRLRPRYWRLSNLLGVFLAWWVVPLTLSMLSLRTVVRRDMALTATYLSLTAAALVIGTLSFAVARRMYQSERRPQFPLHHAIAVAVFGFVAIFALGLFRTPTANPVARVLGFGGNADLQRSPGSPITFESAELVSADLRGAAMKWLNASEADFRGSDLRSADLKNATLRAARLEGADLRDADLSGADARHAMFTRAQLRGAKLANADLRGAVLNGTDLRGCEIGNARLVGAVVEDANLASLTLTGADLRDARLARADLTGIAATSAQMAGTDLSEAILARARLGGADLSSARLRGAKLDEADLSGANLFGSDFGGVSAVGANLSRIRASKALLDDARFEHANLSFASLKSVKAAAVDFRSANLSHADLSKGRTWKADFRGARLLGTDFTGCTLLKADMRGADLSKTRGLTKAQLALSLTDGKTRLPSHLTSRPKAKPTQKQFAPTLKRKYSKYRRSHAHKYRRWR